VEHRHLLPNEIDLLLDGEVGFGVTPLRAHVRRCPQCRAELEEARAMTAELEALPHLAPSPLFADRVMAQVQVFQPAHVAAIDTARRWLPQSRPARLLAGAAATSAAFVLSLVTIWLGANFDTLLFLAEVGVDRGRVALVNGVGRFVTGALGEPAVGALTGGGAIGLVIGLGALLAAIVAAAFALRAVTVSSRRRRI
jgi:hypothetical protein